MLVLTLAASRLAALDIPSYQAGDRVQEDIVTPFPLRVVDAKASETLKQREAARVQLIARFRTAAASEAEAAFRAVFDETRTNFLNHLEVYFKKRRLQPEQIASPEFALLRTTFQGSNELYPVSPKLAAAWAKGTRGRDFLVAASERLRSAMQQPIRESGAPVAFRGNRTRLMNVKSLDEVLPPESLANRGRVTSRTNVLSMAVARQQFIRTAGDLGQAEAQFVSNFLKPNCDYDVALTEKVQICVMEDMWALAEFQPGDTVARKGQVVDEVTLSALNSLRKELEREALKQSAQLSSQAIARAQQELQWLWIGCGIVGAGFVVVTIQWWRRRREASLLPALIGQNSSEAAIWQQRAIEAEQRVERAQLALRAGVMTQVSTTLTGQLVQDLAVQRKDLIEAQRAAATEMKALEKRLDDLQSPLQERLRAYESRIQELETELAAKDEQNRELIKAKIAMARKQLDSERAKSGVSMN
jgi:hypothetical protein